jgi:flagellar protein FliO/FliZ
MNAAWSSLGWFALILIAIPAVLWLFKMSPLGRLQGLKPQLGECPMRPMATLALSPSQKLVTVEVGQGAQRRWLVLGVTPGSITTLERIDPNAGLGQADPAWRQPALHTTGPEAADTGMMATQRLDRLPEPQAAETRPSAPVLPFASMLARLRGQAVAERHG